jgi:hypothetical protein
MTPVCSRNSRLNRLGDSRQAAASSSIGSRFMNLCHASPIQMREAQTVLLQIYGIF